MTWTPKGWWTPIASTAAELRMDFICDCVRCASDGQHNPLCEVHQEPPAACDCTRSETPKSVPTTSGAS